MHAVPESIALCWPASIEGQVLRAILSPKGFANVCKRDWLRIQDSRLKIQDSRSKIQDSRFKIQDSRFKIQDSRFKKNFLNPWARIRRVSGFKKFFLNLESWILNLESRVLDLES